MTPDDRLATHLSALPNHPEKAPHAPADPDAMPHRTPPHAPATRPRRLPVGKIILAAWILLFAAIAAMLATLWSSWQQTLSADPNATPPAHDEPTEPPQ